MTERPDPPVAVPGPASVSPADTVDRLDEIRAELSDIANALPVSDARMCVLSAKDSLAMAQDLIEVASDG